MKKQKKELKNRRILIWSGIFISLIAAVVYKTQDNLVQNKDNGIFKDKTENKLTIDEEGEGQEEEYKILSILSDKCRGCGRCVQIDPLHFEMNPQNGKAMVISTKDLDSSNLSLAILNCPGKAIRLE